MKKPCQKMTRFGIRLMQSERRASAGDATLCQKNKSTASNDTVHGIRPMQSERRASAGDATLCQKNKSTASNDTVHGMGYARCDSNARPSESESDTLSS